MADFLLIGQFGIAGAQTVCYVIVWACTFMVVGRLMFDAGRAFAEFVHSETFYNARRRLNWRWYTARVRMDGSDEYFSRYHTLEEIWPMEDFNRDPFMYWAVTSTYVGALLGGSVLIGLIYGLIRALIRWAVA